MSKDKLIPELRFPEFKNEGEWEEKLVSQLAEYENGKAHEQDINEEGKYVVVNSKFISTDGEVRKFTNSANCIARTDDILMVLSDVPNGRAIAKCFSVDRDNFYTVNQRICKLTPTNADSKILYYLLNRNSHFLSFDDGVKQTNLRNEDVLNCPIVLPKNPQEQQKIASCLSSLDEVIAAHTEKLELLKDHKKGLMQNLFPQEGETVPKYRFKEFTDSLKKIGFAELGEIKIGLTHKPDYIDAGVPFLSSKNISGGFIDFINIQHISQEKFDSMPNSTKPKLGDILFTRVGSNLGNPIILEDDIEFGIFVSLGFFRVNKKAFNYYIKYWMESDLFWKQVNQKVAGGAKDNLNSTWLKEFELYIPSVQEQQKIASCLSSLDKLIIAQAKKIEQLKLHKKGLMQGLFPKIND
ncbi:restriction endonuclease subunit S [Flavobacterium sp.]|jgi:type I restriction enzyme S subunit|uniref:restriction endonuclease subunit S n=1 Tax=Flavobacterium sp. TaxID=239 RepID=UPI0037BEA57E